MDIKTIDNTALNNAIKALNGLADAEGKLYIGKKIGFIGVKKETKIESFTTAYEELVNKIYDEKEPLELELPDEVTSFYTVLYPEAADGNVSEDSAGQDTNTGTAPDDNADKNTKKPAPKKDTKKKTAPKGPSPIKLFISDLVEKGEFNRKQVVDKTVAKFPEKAKSTISTYISDGMNEKYCAFDKLIVKGKDDLLKFGKKMK